MAEPAKYVYRFKVKNLDESRDVSDVVHEIEGMTPSLGPILSNPETPVEVRVSREKPITIDPLTVIIFIEVVNLTAKPLLEGFFHKIGEILAERLSDDVDNAVVTRQDN